MVSDLDQSWRRTRMEDKAIQCNLKKSKKLNRIKVITSGEDGRVTTYSNVPSLAEKEEEERIELSGHKTNEVIYSQVDKNLKKERFDHEVLEGDRWLHTKERRVRHETIPKSSKKTDSPIGRSESPSREVPRSKSPTKECHRFTTGHHQSPTRGYQPSSIRSPTLYRQGRMSPDSLASQHRTERSRSKAYGLHADIIRGPVVHLPPRSPSRQKKKPEPIEEWSYPSSTLYKSRTRSPKRVTIEETISISSDDLRPDNSEHSDIGSPRSVVREIDKSGKTISYENVKPIDTTSRLGDTYEGHTTSILVKPLTDDYRKSMTQVDCYEKDASSTFSRSDLKKRLTSRGQRDYSPLTATVVDNNSYIMEETSSQKSRRRGHSETCSHRRHQVPSEPGFQSRGLYSNGSTTSASRRHYSNFDLRSDIGDYRRGGLAAAYKARQSRAVSLNRFGFDTGSLCGSQTRLGGYHNFNSSASDAGLGQIYSSRHTIYEPVVLHIPGVNHRNQKADEDDRASGINLARTQSILSSSKKYSTKPKSKSPTREVKTTTEKLNDYIRRGKPSSTEGFDETDENLTESRDENFNQTKPDKSKSKSEIKRHQSMPKDSKKFPWLQKLKLKVKSKDS